MRSDRMTRGLERVPSRALLAGAGMPRSELGKPMIGVASSFTDLIAGHVGMRDLERYIEKGVHAGGGYPFLFGIPGICDGIAMGHKGMSYSLPSRELIADCGERRRSTRPGRPGAAHQLRQDHPRHAHGRSAARHPLHRGHRRADALGPATRSTTELRARHVRGHGPPPEGGDLSR